MSTLAEIFRRHGCDKWQHGYHAVYEKLPAPARMLEVGVYKGASMWAWREWWGPDPLIVGIDTYERAATYRAPGSYLRERLVLLKGDARTYHFADEMLQASLDLIIDDGSHKPRDQAATFRNLWPLLAPGGTYFIEDVLLVMDDGLIPAWFAAKRHDFNREAFMELMAAIHEAGQNPTAHDFRAQSGKVDSVLLEIRKPA